MCISPTTQSTDFSKLPKDSVFKALHGRHKSINIPTTIQKWRRSCTFPLCHHRISCGQIPRSIKKSKNKRVAGWTSWKKDELHWCQNTYSDIQCTKYHNVVPCLQADQFNGQNPAWNMLPPNVHILIARKRVYLLCSIGIFCTDIPRQVGDERYYSNTTTVSQNHSIFPFKIPSFLPHNFKYSWDPIPKATTGQRIRLDTLYLTLLTSSQG